MVSHISCGHKTERHRQGHWWQERLRGLECSTFKGGELQSEADREQGEPLLGIGALHLRNYRRHCTQYLQCHDRIHFRQGKHLSMQAFASLNYVYYIVAHFRML